MRCQFTLLSLDYCIIIYSNYLHLVEVLSNRPFKSELEILVINLHQAVCLRRLRWSSAADTWLSLTWKWTFENVWLNCFRTLGNYIIFYIISYSLFSNSFNILCDAIIMICAWALDWSLMSKTKRDTLSKPHKLSPVWYILWPRCVRVTAA